MEFDVVVVGAGPAGLATAIRLKQLAAEKGKDLGVCVVEKGSEVGAHILSGAVIDPRALAELFPNWKEEGAPLNQPVTEDRFLFLTETRLAQGARLRCCPDCFTNHGYYIASLGNLVPLARARRPRRWASRSIRASPRRRCSTPRTARCAAWPPATWASASTARRPRATSRAWSCTRSTRCSPKAAAATWAGSSRRATSCAKASAPQVYGIGLKELWEVKPEKHVPGLVVHTAGWPLDGDTYGGSFLYHLENNQVSVGFVVGLGYENPYLHPFEEFQRYKTHPAIRGFFEGGRRIAYGARAITAGGLQSLPKLTFPGGVLVGDDAGFLNAARIKGSHAAIKSGMLAAEAAFEALAAGRSRRRAHRLSRGVREELAARRAAPRAQLQAAPCPRASTPAR